MDLNNRVMQMLQGRAAMGAGKKAAPKKRRAKRAGADVPAVPPAGRVYVDNAQNRSLKRVGKPIKPRKKKKAKRSKLEACVYADTTQNRNLNRVGLPKKQQRKSCVYADNAQNRKLGRVGLPRGSVPAPAAPSGGIQAGIMAGGNPWVQYVKDYASMNNMSYSDALQQAGPSYRAQGY